MQYRFVLSAKSVLQHAANRYSNFNHLYATNCSEQHGNSMALRGLFAYADSLFLPPRLSHPHAYLRTTEFEPCIRTRTNNVPNNWIHDVRRDGDRLIVAAALHIRSMS